MEPTFDDCACAPYHDPEEEDALELGRPRTRMGALGHGSGERVQDGHEGVDERPEADEGLVRRHGADVGGVARVREHEEQTQE